jgi:predicted nucleic acid-binding protein
MNTESVVENARLSISLHYAPDRDNSTQQPRLLTNTSTMRDDVLTQAQAWGVFDAFAQISAAKLIEEPHGIDPLFRRLTDRDEASTKQWADGYLAAFAEAANVMMVTFDQALAGQVRGAILLC